MDYQSGQSYKTMLSLLESKLLLLTLFKIRILQYKPAFYIVPMLVLRNPMQLARHVDTLNDVPVLIERCIQCTRSPGLY